jgi:MYXO-CTERM domain-containing protein
MRARASRRKTQGVVTLAATGAALSALFAARDAAAFCRTTTVPVSADYDPVNGCWNQGNVLYWANACVGYSLQHDASRSVSFDAAGQAIANAFAKWTGTACPTDGTGSSRVSIDVRDLGPVQCDQVQYNQDQPNQHVIVFRDDHWPHNDANNTLALTTVTFNPDTGEIYDADMEINSHDQTLTATGPVPANGYDFESIVTHETGHFLGMAHSGDTRATMFAHYQPGSTAMRNLTSDDVTGICSVYPPNGTRTTSQSAIVEGVCDPTPRHGFSTQCGEPTKKGCIPSSIGAAPPDSGVAVGVLGVIAGALVIRRRRSSAPRS